ncbi:MAG: DNA polymerase I [Dehalococcoidia bacterium]|nr:DNA polymerase I [Dehalococcoidia bacterium]
MTSSEPPHGPASAASDPSEAKTLLILDSHGIIYRSYFALREALTLRKTGEPVGAVYGFANSLLYALDTLHPDYIVAAWDGPTPTFRHESDERYKATRRPMPDDLRPQVGRVRALLDAFRIPVLEVPGFEADDVVGALSTQAAAQGINVVILTLDNDMVQLIGGPVRVQMYRPYQRDYVMYDADAVRDRWGFEPAQMVDYKALVGDNSDNIPGVKGIGEKGAVALIQQWGSVEAMLEHLAEVTPTRARTALEAGRDEALHSKTMATIVRDVPGVTLDLEACVVADYDRDAVLEMFRELEFRSLVSRLPDHVTDGPGPQAAVERAPAEDRQYEVVRSAARLAEVVREVRRAGRFGYEVVADDAHPMRAADSLVGIGLSTQPAAGWYVPFGHTTEAAPPSEGQQELLLDAPAEAPPAVDQLTQAEVLRALEPLFTDASLERATHDAKFGTLALAEAAGGFWPAPAAFDTMIAAYLLGDPNVTIRGLAFNRLGQELVDPKVLLGTGRKAITYSRTTPEDCAAFATGNADLALRLASVLQQDLEANALLGVFEDLDMPHVPVLARMERWGLAVDVEVLHEQAHVLEQAVADAEAEVFASVGHEFQIGSPQQLSHVFFTELGLPKTRKTATGFTTDATALEPLRHVHPAVEAVLRWREVTKIKSTYVDTLPHQINPRTGRIHSVFSQVTAATGRLSSSDPNLQNIPLRTEIGNAVRRAFVARDCGESPRYVSFDYSQIELRVLAHMCGDDELREAFDRGLDIHAATSARVFNVPITDVTPEMRRRAKVFNFGVLYGLTAFGLSQREGIPRDEAEEFIRHYFEAYPSVAAWRDRVVDEARAKGYASTLTGRRRYIPELRASNRNQRMAAERVAINMPIQGTAADIIKIAMNRIDAELLDRQSRGAQARMVLQVHDELIFETPQSEVDDVREIAHRLMPSLELAVPLVIDEKSGRSWGDFA